MGYFRKRDGPRGIEPSICIFVGVGLISLVLLTYSERLWTNNFRKSVPVIDNIMQAQLALADGHLWMEELLKGNEAIKIDAVLGLYDQAVHSVEASMNGKSAISDLPGLPLEEGDLRVQLGQFKDSIQRTRGIVEERWSNGESGQQGTDPDLKLHMAIHGLGLMAAVINQRLQEKISETIKRQRRIHAVKMGLWLMLLGGAIGLLLAGEEKKMKAEKALIESEERLRSLSSHLLSAQENERRRISFELHDELGQSLTVLKLQLRSIERNLSPHQKELKEDCVNTRRYADQVIENVRRLSRDLSPGILEDLGLVAALRCLTEDFAKHSGIEISLHMDDMNGLFPREAQIIIYRIIQETLTNIVRHSHASRVSIISVKREEEARFVVEDNGMGFDPVESKAGLRRDGGRGLGLAAMDQRARMLGGTLDISSQKTKGTTIAFTVPLEKGRRG